jgi:hypothetical protein
MVGRPSGVIRLRPKAQATEVQLIDEDIETCPDRGSTLQVIACIEEPLLV